MVRHIVMWSLEGNLTKQEKKETAGKIKELLEPIKEKVCLLYTSPSPRD